MRNFIEEKLANFFYPSGNCLVHVGKVGGSTIKGCLRRTGQLENYDIAHVNPPVFFSPSITYFLMVRDPVDRIISSYNWSHKAIFIKHKKERYRGERKVHLKYASIDDLASQLYAGDTKNPAVHRDLSKIHHVKKGLYHYIHPILKHPQGAGRIHYVFCQEQLNTDILTCFGIDNKVRRNDNSDYAAQTTLSARSRANIRKYAHKDYEILQKLYDLDLLSKAMYDRYMQT